MKKSSNRLTEDVKLLQKVVLKHSDRFLILQRDESSKSRPLAWDLPGGNSQWPDIDKSKGSLHQEDAAREVLEETGIEISLDHFITENLVNFSTFFEAQKQVFTVIVGWKVELPADFDENSVNLSHEHIKFEWIELKKLDEFDFGGFKGEFIKEIVRNSF